MSRDTEIAQNLASVQSKITRPEVTLIVVTKTYPASDVQILRDLGVENFGENRNARIPGVSIIHPPFSKGSAIALEEV